MSSPIEEAIHNPPARRWWRPFDWMHPAQKFAAFCWVAVVAAILGLVAFSLSIAIPSVVPVYESAAHRWMDREDLYEYKYPWDVYRYPPCFAPSFVPLHPLAFPSGW